MRVVEILLPKGASRDRGLSPQVVQRVDFLQQRMDGYVDKILAPGTSQAAKDFLKDRLRADFYELRGLIPEVNEIAEGTRTPTLADKSEKGVPKNPKGGRRQCTDCGKVFSKLGIMRHRCIPKKLDEAVHRLPLSNADFELAKKMLEKPIPAVIAPIYIEGLIEDDELTAQFKSIEESEPARDVRPLIVEWFKRVMPDQMYRFTGDTRDATQEKGILSPIHGYDPKMYRGTNDPITGDAYGRF